VLAVGASAQAASAAEPSRAELAAMSEQDFRAMLADHSAIVAAETTALTKVTPAAVSAPCPNIKNDGFTLDAALSRLAFLLSAMAH
jgi:hypothetical protein